MLVPCGALVLGTGCLISLHPVLHEYKKRPGGDDIKGGPGVDVEKSVGGRLQVEVVAFTGWRRTKE